MLGWQRVVLWLHLSLRCPRKSGPSLDRSEEQLLGDLETGGLHSVATDELLSQLQEAARRSGIKDQRIEEVGLVSQGDTIEEAFSHSLSNQPDLDPNF